MNLLLTIGTGYPTIILASTCTLCLGVGMIKTEPDGHGNSKSESYCPSCKGRGTIITPSGEAVIQLMNFHRSNPHDYTPANGR